MEDSKLYSNQDIEKLKQSIQSYRETLTSLKVGKPVEDYLYMKKEFDDLKTQIGELKGITEETDGNQNARIKGNEELVKHVSTQIESLNQTIVEMNQEILTILNKLLADKNNKRPKATYKDTSSHNYSNSKSTSDQSTMNSKQPSYKMLQSLAGKAIKNQLDVNKGTSSSQNENQFIRSDERHFNQQYFQSFNSYPSEIYNGLYRNTTNEYTIHFKNTSNSQELPKDVYEPNSLSHDEIQQTTHNELDTNDLNEDEQGDIINIDNEVITDEKSNIETLNNNVGVEFFEKSSEESELDISSSLQDTGVDIYEPKIEEFENESRQEINQQFEIIVDPIGEETKKEKNASLFNFFRKWS